jgi:hypothetical protein
MLLLETRNPRSFKSASSRTRRHHETYPWTAIRWSGYDGKTDIFCNDSLLLCALTPLAIAAAPAEAQTIVDEWTNVKLPEAPELKPVTIDPKTTALLMLDFMNQNCGKRPRCLASIPVMQKLLGEARSQGASHL